MENQNENQSETKTQLTYRDTVFVDLFGKCAQAKENFLSLYNAIHGTDLKLEETEITPLMLDNTVYIGRYNDVSMMIDGKIIVLIEQQTSINKNMPLRFLEYVARLYDKLIPQVQRYNHSTIPLPVPEFYVFYNGTANYPAEKTLRLSDAFRKNDENLKDFPLELVAKVYNINKRNEIPLVDECKTLSGYATLVDYAKEAKSEKIENNVDYAVQRCIKEGILSDYLKLKSTEVRNMLIGDYDYETDIRVQREEAYESGASYGEKRGRAEQKAEDEKVFAQKDAEIQRLKAELQAARMQN